MQRLTRSHGSCLIRCPLWAVLAAACLSGAAARADLIVSVQSVTVAAGGTGTVEIDVQNTGGSDVTIGGFSFALQVAGTDITLTGVAQTAIDYIFDGQSYFGSDIGFLSSPQEAFATDVSTGVLLSSPTGARVAAGSTVGLGLVSFSDSSPSASSYDLTLDAIATTLSDPGSNPISVDAFGSGKITATGPASVVPEPGTLAPAVVAVAVVALARRRPRLRPRV